MRCERIVAYTGHETLDLGLAQPHAFSELLNEFDGMSMPDVICVGHAWDLLPKGQALNVFGQFSELLGQELGRAEIVLGHAIETLGDVLFAPLGRVFGDEVA